MQVVCWSNYHGQAGNTSNAIAIALSLAMNSNSKVLLCSMQYYKNNIDSAFFESNELKELDSGIDSIERVARAKDLNVENFKSYTTTLIKDRLDFLTSSSKASYELFSKINDSIKDILYMANKVYDFVIVDVNTGLENEITQKILKVLDENNLVVVNMCQNEKLIHDFFKKDKKQLERLTNNNKMIINIGNYDSKIKCNKKYIDKLYKNQIPIYYVPYNSDFKDSINNHKVIEFFKVNSNKENENEVFFNEVNKISNKLIELNDRNIEVIKEPIKKVGFAQKFKSILEL